MPLPPERNGPVLMLSRQDENRMNEQARSRTFTAVVFIDGFFDSVIRPLIMNVGFGQAE